MRDILHCDLNSFFASVECLKEPSLKNVPMAVCGDPKLRHGIILAKNDIAKSYGIYTPETVYSARKKCPSLVLVKSNYEDYVKYSKLVNSIYLKYTDMVEPFSIDESFLDVTESKNLFGNPCQIAYKIKEEVKNTLGLTISIGVSFNKTLAKLGSDLKKPDAITHIPYKNFREIIFPLPVEKLLFAGKATIATLSKLRIKTIGDLANYNKYILIKKLGKSGEVLYNFANGFENSKVLKWGEWQKRKSISKGHTFEKDLDNSKDIINYIKRLVYEIVKILRENNFKASIVNINIKNSNFITINRQKKIEYTNLYQTVLNNILELFKINYIEGEKIRAVTVGLSGLIDDTETAQINLFEYIDKNEKNVNYKIENITNIMDDMDKKFGSRIITFGNMIE